MRRCEPLLTSVHIGDLWLLLRNHSIGLVLSLLPGKQGADLPLQIVWQLVDRSAAHQHLQDGLHKKGVSMKVDLVKDSIDSSYKRWNNGNNSCCTSF